jgi:cell division protein ZapE
VPTSFPAVRIDPNNECETAWTLSDCYGDLVANNRISSDPGQVTAIQRLQQLLEEVADYTAGEKKSFARKLFWSRRKSPQGVYIHGDVGRGKSMLMDLFFNHCPIEAKRRVHFHVFMLEAHRFMHRWRAEHEGDPIGPLARHMRASALLLCIDEFQVSDIADAMILGRLFGMLFELGVVVVATSNRHPEDLYRNGLQRERFLPFIDLLKQHNELIELAGPQDYRLMHMRSLSTTYFTPLGPSAEAFVRRSFDELTHGAAMAPGSLHVNGREIKFGAVSGDVATARFSDLCESVLGAADYRELACDFSTLIVSDIPRLTAEERNEAKRFATLIDVMYEHKAKLICTAAVPPDRLYVDGKGAFEFQRTVSRLIEMQSERYWHTAHEPG